MGKHSIVHTAQSLADTPAFKGMAVATVVGTFFGIGSSIAVAAPEDTAAQEDAAKEIKTLEASTVDLAEGIDAANQDVNNSGWTFNTASVEVKEPAPEPAPRSASAHSASSSSTFSYAPVPYNGSLNEQILGIARQGIGVPYVWGGSSPAGWDCSGFVMWILAQTGRSVSHGADSIARAGTQVPASEAQPGDLVWWPGRHIAVYAGGGQIIGAQDYGIGTVQTSLYGSYVFVRMS